VKYAELLKELKEKFAVYVYCFFPAVLTMKEHQVDWVPALRMYRGVFLVVLFIFLLGVNTYGWRSSGVNHVLIFELDPRHHLAHQEFMEVSLVLRCVLSSVYFLSILYYYYYYYY